MTWRCLAIGVHPLSLLLNYISTLCLYFLNEKPLKDRDTSGLSKSFKLQKRTSLWGNCLVSKVLVAVDGSENSERALDFALNFAEKYNSALTIVNVSDSSAVAAYPDDSMVVVAKDLRKFHEDILEKATAHAKQANPSISVSSSFREGDPALEIASAAKEGNFDVVVVGHLGVGKVRGLFLGSISEKVTRLVSCTVIIVR